MISESRITHGRCALELADLLQPARQDWTLGDLMIVLRRRHTWLIGCTGCMLLLAGAYCLIATPRFQATGVIEVQKESAAAFGLENSVTGDAANGGSDSLDYSMTLETEASILQSATLALQVIRDLNLETTHDYFPVQTTGIHIPGWIFLWRKPVEPLSINLETAPNRRYVALKIFAAHLKVTPQTGTRLIEVSYSDPNPELAAAVVNHLIQTLTDYTYQARFHATAQASSWLASQLTDLRRQTQTLQDRASRLQRDTGIYGEDASHDIILERLDALNQRVAAAESNRLLAEAIYRVSQSGDPELISGLSGSAAATPAFNNSLASIQTLRGREAAVRAEIAESSERYGAAHPHIAELHSELDGIEQSIHEEVARIGERSRTGFEVAQAAEKSAEDSFEKQKALANAASGRSAAYQLARQEAEGSRGVYQSLLAKLKEAGVLEGLRSTNLTVVNPGRVPPTNRPRSPNIPLSFAAAMIGGLFLGSVGAVASELSDDTIQSLAGLERLIESPLLGVLPELHPDKRLRRLRPSKDAKEPVRRDPLFIAGDRSNSLDARFVEALRSLRTSLLLLRPDRHSQVVLVTSSIPGEGKSKVAVNLAGMLAQLGSRVLLVDADLRCPSVHDELGIPSRAGLATALLANAEPEILRYPPLKKLSVVCGQDAARTPAELLASQQMTDLLREWRTQYDFVLLDSPPLLPATDALVLSQMSDIALLVARHGFTPQQAIHRGFATLRDQIPGTCLMRVVLNGANSSSYDFHEYYGFKPQDYRRTSAGRPQ